MVSQIAESIKLQESVLSKKDFGKTPSVWTMALYDIVVSVEK